LAPAPRRLATSTGPRRRLVGLTPLIDVVFILLVFFMLASSFQDWRAIDLTASAAAGASTPMEGALLVEVRSDGLRLAADPVSLDVLVARVGQRVASQPEVPVLVKPASGVVLQEMVRVLDALAAVGVTGLSLIRDPRD